MEKIQNWAQIQAYWEGNSNKKDHQPESQDTEVLYC